MKDIQDYLHLYFGCTCYYESKKGLAISKVSGSMIDSPYHYPNIRLSLRPLSDMTEEERAEKKNIHDSNKNAAYRESECLRYLLSKHFDLFGLIESGLVIDKTKMKLTNLSS